MDLHLQAWILAILVGLAIAVLVGSVIIILLIIFILRRVQRIAQRADDMTESIPEFIRVIGKRFAPIALTSLVGTILKRVSRSRKNSED